MLQLSRTLLYSTGPPRDAAAVLAARLLTRPGLHAQLREYVSWGVEQIQNDKTTAAGAEGEEGAPAAEWAEGGGRPAAVVSHLVCGGWSLFLSRDHLQGAVTVTLYGTLYGDVTGPLQCHRSGVTRATIFKVAHRRC